MAVKKLTGPLIIVINNREEASRVLAEYAGAKDKIEEAEAKLQARLDALRAEHMTRIAAPLASIKQCADALEEWAERSPKEFSEKRSIDFINGRIGIRTGNRALDLLSRITWDDVLAKVKELFPKYVVKRESVDGEQILRDSAGDKPVLDAKQISSLGLKVVQEERFYIKPKKL